ncbi:MAG: SDR family NAD(P)-dependent oxidoreductase, partial [Pirellulales bacterium]
RPPRTYLVADGCPVVRADYYAEVARWLGAPPPTFTCPAPGSPAAHRAAADRKISNRRLRDELQVELRYPSYREGLRTILAEK